jgi:hypothetical protein
VDPATNHLRYGTAQMKMLCNLKPGAETTINGDHTKSSHGLFQDTIKALAWSALGNN